MNLLGRRSLSSFLKVLLDMAFYLACAFAAVSVVVAVVASRTNTNNISVDLPVRFAVNPSAIHGADGAAVNAHIGDASGLVTLEHPPVTSVVLTVLGVLAVDGVIILVLYRLRRIFRRLVEGRPFLNEN